MSAAVQLSGLAERIGMAQSTQVVQTKMLDYFFSLRKLHKIAFQPIVTLANGELYEYECLFRPDMPMLPQSITSVVQAAINTDRGVELDVYIVATILDAGRRGSRRPPRDGRQAAPPLRDQPDALQPARSGVRGGGHRRPGPCGRAGPAPDHDRMHRAAVGLGHRRPPAPGPGAAQARLRLRGRRRRGRLRELRPHRRAAPDVIKIDRDIVHGIGHDDAKQALVEAFVSFGRRIGARLLAEGIERRADIAALTTLGVDLGQGYLLGRPAAEPAPPADRARAAQAHSAARRPCGAQDAARRALAYHRGHDRPSLPDHVRAFLDDVRFATIATIDPDGTPRQAVIWYTLDGDEIVINSAVGRRWPTNLLRDPRMSLAVVDGAMAIAGSG